MDSIFLAGVLIAAYLGVIVYVLVLLTRHVRAVESIATKMNQ